MTGLFDLCRDPQVEKHGWNGYKQRYAGDGGKETWTERDKVKDRDILRDREIKRETQRGGVAVSPGKGFPTDHRSLWELEAW